MQPFARALLQPRALATSPRPSLLARHTPSGSNDTVALKTGDATTARLGRRDDAQGGGGHRGRGGRSTTGARGSRARMEGRESRAVDFAHGSTSGPDGRVSE